MINYGVIGTNWISEHFIAAAQLTNKLQFVALYSRDIEKAKTMAPFKTSYYFDSLEEMAKSNLIDAVYIASPNSLHYEQSLLFLSHDKHVICEKPMASNFKQTTNIINYAKQQNLVLLEAFKTMCLPSFESIINALPKIEPLHKVYLTYCQYSSRYDQYKAGKNPNTFNPTFSNGSIMDIGYYCVATAVAFFGEPKSLLASAHLLESGVDAHGSVILHYDSFDVVITHSKVSNHSIESELQGEKGNITIKKLSNCSGVNLILDNESIMLHTQSPKKEMFYEAEYFANLILNGETQHKGHQVSLITSKLLTEIRRQTGVIFPADA